jgi:fatty-acyl-CoA synthase
MNFKYSRRLVCESHRCLTGRIKDTIIRGGENISPREIEEFLYHIPGVKDAQVVAVTSPKYGEDVGAFIIPHDGFELTREDVRDFCKDKISHYKIPRYVFFLDEYPLTGSGKIQKFKLREMALEICDKQGIVII